MTLRGLRGRSIAVSVTVFLLVGTVSALLTFQFMRSMSLSLGKEYAMQHVEHHSNTLSSMLSTNIRLAQKITTAGLLLSWLENESDEVSKKRALKLMNDSVNIAQADSWFIAFKESRHFYFDDKANLFRGKELLKQLQTDTSEDAWFYHTLHSATPYNMNIDYDSAVGATKLWLNVPVTYEGVRVAVIGFGIDYKNFIDDYIMSSNHMLTSMVLSTKGAILAHPNPSKATYNVHTSEASSWNMIWPMLDETSKERLNMALQMLPYSKERTNTLELNVEGKECVVALSYIPELEWVGFSMLNIKDLVSLYDVRYSIGIFLLLAFLSAFVAYWMTEQYLLKPITDLSRVAKSVSKGDYSVRLHRFLDRDDELSDLGYAMNEMIEKVESVTLDAQERYRWLAENSQDVIWVMDTQGKLVYISPSAERLRGYSVEEEMAMALEDTVCEESLPVIKEFMGRAMEEIKKGKIPIIPEHRVKQPRKDGTTFWAEVNVRVLPYFKDGSICFIGVTRDISERIKAEEEIKQLAFYDPLTTLANRRLLLDRLDTTIHACHRKKILGALVFLDLDGFKPLNDTYGHQIGDELLVHVAKRIKSAVRIVDTVGRYGGDEFVVLLPDLGPSKEAAQEIAKTIANKIGTLISEPYILSVTEYRLTASIGVVLFGESETDAKTILDEADSAMYQAKEAGKDCVIIKGALV